MRSSTISGCRFSGCLLPAVLGTLRQNNRTIRSTVDAGADPSRERGNLPNSREAPAFPLRVVSCSSLKLRVSIIGFRSALKGLNAALGTRRSCWPLHVISLRLNFPAIGTMQVHGRDTGWVRIATIFSVASSHFSAPRTHISLDSSSQNFVAKK
jgi:hypothetical protein